MGLNYVLYQAGWFACVGGAAWSYPWLGAVLGTVTLATHIVLAERREDELRLACVMGGLGTCIESLQMASGTLMFASGGSIVGWLPPVWIVLLWMQFAGTLRFSLRWLTARRGVAVAAGAISGPLAYTGVSGFGLVHLQSPRWRSLLVMSMLWGLVMFAAATVARTGLAAGTGTYRPHRRLWSRHGMR